MNSMNFAAPSLVLNGLPPISQQIWNGKFRFKTLSGDPIDLTIDDTWKRIATALSVNEPSPTFRDDILSALTDFKFLPGGRIIAGAGTKRRVTFFSCFVMGNIEDDLGSIFEHLREDALTMQQGGGIGNAFSVLRPKGAPVHRVGADASGPVSFMDVWDAMCETIKSAGERRGAMMGCMRCDHPDIEDFITAKRRKGRLTNFNLSVLITDAFIAAVEADTDWPLVFNGTTYRVIKARELWHKIMRAAYEYAEPGAIFIDQINKRNNLYYCEKIEATNPCGEQPLPPYGACDLGSLNLSQLVENPFTNQARIDDRRLAKLATTAVRALDNVIDISGYPLPQQQQESISKRRIGLGMTGLADALTMCRLHYGTEEAVKQAEHWLKVITRTAYLASTDLATEKGTFPLFDRDDYLAGETIQNLDPDVQEAIAKKGIRNSHLISLAPTGTISLFAHNTSSSIEPIFDFAYTRKIRQPDGSTREEEVVDYAVALFRERFGQNAALPDYFVSAQSLTPGDHLRMQAALQRHVDSAISKTINCPESISFEDFQNIYLDAHHMGCKGCTTHRPNEITGSVLSINTSPSPSETAAPAISVTPISRPDTLIGSTYKLRWPDSPHAYYVTINDIETENGRRPFEIFINSKDLQNYAWVAALTRMISAVFRHRGDVSFVTDELKAIFDPRGGTWAKGRYVPSLIASIGETLEQHMITTGFLAKPADILEHFPANEASTSIPAIHLGPLCPKCSQPGLINKEGCLTCKHCGWSKCS